MARKPKLDIETYNKKRDFSKTKEPKGRKLKGKGGGKKEEAPNTSLQKIRDWWEKVLKEAKKK